MSRKQFLFIIVLSILLCSWILVVEAEATMWTQTYGGANYDYGRCVVETSDEGYAIAGSTSSFGAGGQDFWLVKTDALGNMEWNQTYGGTNYDEGYSVVQTSDGGYALVGYTYSFGAGHSDFWLVKTDALGNMEWNKTYGGTEEEVAHSLIATSDGGYAIIGNTEPFVEPGDFNDVAYSDFWLVKTDSYGNMEWNQTYGGADWDFGMSMVETSDGGYAIAGYTGSFGAGSSDAWLIKTDSTGNMKWNKTYGGAEFDFVQSLVVTADEGYALAGHTKSYEAGSGDFWLVKTDATGNAQWNRTYGGAYFDSGYSVVETSDGGYAIAGNTEYPFGDGDQYILLIKTDENGNAQWNQTYGEIGTWTYCECVVETGDGGYAMAGFTYFGGSVDLHNDFFLVKTDEYGVVPEATWIILPLLAIATVSIFISKTKLLCHCSQER